MAAAFTDAAIALHGSKLFAIFWHSTDIGLSLSEESFERYQTNQQKDKKASRPIANLSVVKSAKT